MAERCSSGAPLEGDAVKDATGFAVIDTETTGLLPGFHHRIAEIAIIHLDATGSVTDEWCTLVNPERDLGPQAVHGIRAADVRRAPTFQRISCEVIERLRGRVPVAHNWPFDAMHLRAEFSRLDIRTPLESRAGLCTMRLAGRVLPGAGRSLLACCDSAGISMMGWHSALADARAAASLLEYYIVPQHCQRNGPTIMGKLLLGRGRCWGST